jgi:hypothetical protein
MRMYQKLKQDEIINKALKSKCIFIKLSVCLTTLLTNRELRVPVVYRI